MTEYTSKVIINIKNLSLTALRKTTTTKNKKTKENLIIYPELDVEVSPTIFGWMISGFMNGPNNTSVLTVQVQEDTL